MSFRVLFHGPDQARHVVTVYAPDKTTALARVLRLHPDTVAAYVTSTR